MNPESRPGKNSPEWLAVCDWLKPASAKLSPVQMRAEAMRLKLSGAAGHARNAAKKGEEE